MPLLPSYTAEYSTQEITETFAGLNRNLKIGDGEFNDTCNLSTEYYPLLSCRGRRGYVKDLTAPMGLIAKTKLAYVDGGTLYYDGTATGLTELEEGEKQLVSMGAYICVFPDKAYYNTADATDYGSMESSYYSSGNVRYSMCKLDGTEYAQPAKSDTAPASPENGSLWIDTSQSSHVLKQYSEATNEWVSVATVYTKLTFNTKGVLPPKFSEHDGIRISGAAVGDVNGDKIIYGIGGDAETDDYLIVVGLLDKAETQTSGSVHLDRETPELDYVCEAQNRLWGCRYGDDLNEIYCCALGDFKNWRKYMGLSTDSWTASVGSDGEWTGAVNYLGYPMFFKEDRLYRVSVSGAGAHSVSETVCRGVQKGSEKSLVVVNETLFYKSRSDVCAYQGGFPQGISEALGQEAYSDAAAGAVKELYYISMLDSANRAHLFVFNTRNGIWIREDELRCSYFARLEDELYCIADNRLIALRGSTGTLEPYVEWMAESGMLYYKAPEHKYVSRFNIRVQMEEGAEVEIWLRYDEDPNWILKGTIKSSRNRTVPIPIRPRRCDHLRIKLKGKGEFKLFSISRNLSYGSDAG